MGTPACVSGPDRRGASPLGPPVPHAGVDADESAIRAVEGLGPAARRDDQPSQLASRVFEVNARGHATFGGRPAPGAEGFLASRIARQSGGDYRDRDHVAKWATAIARELRSTTL